MTELGPREDFCTGEETKPIVLKWDFSDLWMVSSPGDFMRFFETYAEAIEYALSDEIQQKYADIRAAKERRLMESSELHMLELLSDELYDLAGHLRGLQYTLTQILHETLTGVAEDEYLRAHGLVIEFLDSINDGRVSILDSIERLEASGGNEIPDK